MMVLISQLQTHGDQLRNLIVLEFQSLHSYFSHENDKRVKSGAQHWCFTFYQSFVLYGPFYNHQNAIELRSKCNHLFFIIQDVLILSSFVSKFSIKTYHNIRFELLQDIHQDAMPRDFCTPV